MTGLGVAAIGASQLDLSWNANGEGDLAGYNVYRSATSGSGFSQIGSSATSSYPDTGLDLSTTYYYQVSAVDTSNNEGVLSDEASGTTEECTELVGEDYKLSKNADFSTEDCNYSMDDTIYMKIWSDRVDYDNLNKAEYEIKVEGVRIKGVLTYNSPDGSYTASAQMNLLPLTGNGTVKLKLEDNSRVKYEVRDIPITLTDVIDITPPAQVIGLGVTAVSDSRLDLSWAEISESDLDRYSVYRSETSGSGFSPIDSSATNSYSDTGLEPSKTYYYYVSAVDTSSNEGIGSDQASGTTLAPDTVPPTPYPMTWEILPAATGSSSISMTATTAEDPSGVEYYFTCTEGDCHDSGWQSSASYEDTGLEPGTTYTYTVKARDLSAGQNETAASDVGSATTEESTELVGEGFKLSKDADFSTEDRDYGIADTIYMKIWSDRVDYDDLKKAEYEIKVEGVRIRIKGVLTYNSPDDSYTASAQMNELPLTGNVTVKLKLEDNSRVKYEVRDIPITLTDP